MAQRRTAPLSVARLDSDADALPFPRGGVFAVDAAPVGAPVGASVGGHRELVGHIDSTLDALQAQLDELTTQVDEAYPFHPTPRSPWRPSAA